MAKTRGFRRKRDGRIELVLDGVEADVLRRVTDDIAEIVASPPDDAMRDRLYPRAYLDPTEEEGEVLFRARLQDELVRNRLAALEVITDTLAPAEGGGVISVVLDEDAQQAWLTATNDARLVLGTMLDVSEDEPLEFAEDDPRFTYALIYDWLTQLQWQLVECLSAGLGTGGTDDER